MKGMRECVAIASDQYAVGLHTTKAMAKRNAAFFLLVKLLGSAGITNPQWREQVHRLSGNDMTNFKKALEEKHEQNSNN